ncbi:MAG: RNA polymerase sigma factor (sigma-70 family) [Pirellulaceae bacterium]
MSESEETKLNSTIVAQLYVDHADELSRFLIGVLRDTALAHDALQTTFAKLVEQGHKTREESRKAWLFRVAYNEAMLFRRRQAVADKANRNLGWTRKNESESADEPLLRMEAVERVRVAVGQLPADQQQIVKMRIYDEKTFAVIAAELNIPLGTALGRMRLATKKLRDALQSTDASQSDE